MKAVKKKIKSSVVLLFFLSFFVVAGIVISERFLTHIAFCFLENLS